MSTLTMQLNFPRRSPAPVYVPLSPRRTTAPRVEAPAPVVVAKAPAQPKLSWLDRLDRWVDGWTDDRAELERYLARSQNIVDLENRMRDVLNTPPALRF